MITFKEWINENKKEFSPGNIEDLLKKIKKDSLGSCMYVAELITRYYLHNQFKDFKVIEGYVRHHIDDESKDAHTWIELNSGEIIDPTIKQFYSIFGENCIRVGPYKRYKPEEYLELCKKHPISREDRIKHYR